MQYVSRQITALNTENLMNHRVHIAHCNDRYFHLKAAICRFFVSLSGKYHPGKLKSNYSGLFFPLRSSVQSPSSSIYLLSSMRSVSVKQCSRTTLVTGPVAGTLYLTGCVGLRIISISRRVVLRQTSVVSLKTFFNLLQNVLYLIWGLWFNLAGIATTASCTYLPPPCLCCQLAVWTSPQLLTTPSTLGQLATQPTYTSTSILICGTSLPLRCVLTVGRTMIGLKCAYVCPCRT